MKNRTFLFIDGSNFYAGQYELFGPQKYLVFSKLIGQLEKKLKVSFDNIYFYASYSPKPKKPNQKQKIYLKNEALFYRSVHNTPKVTFFKGYRSKTSGKEKEVDVKLAVDMVDFAHRNMYHQMYLMSGDADFMEALHVAKRLDKRVSTICIENKIMYKSLLFYPMYVIAFSQYKIRLDKIHKLPVTIKLEAERIIRSL